MNLITSAALLLGCKSSLLDLALNLDLSKRGKHHLMKGSFSNFSNQFRESPREAAKSAKLFRIFSKVFKTFQVPGIHSHGFEEFFRNATFRTPKFPKIPDFFKIFGIFGRSSPHKSMKIKE